jgi:hypothetical protein
MELEYLARVLYANGQAAAGVAVRIFDEDDPGKGDDDLTISPGVSDANGLFSLRYAPSRYLDASQVPSGERLSHLWGWAGESALAETPDRTDIYKPYLELRYTIGSQARLHRMAFSPYKTEIRLPESLPLGFLPTRHGFRFANSFPGSLLPFTIPGLPTGNIPPVYGLCGGMASAAYDLYLAGRDVPNREASSVLPPPARRTRLHRYLFRRLIDSFGFGVPLIKLAQWMTMPLDTPLGLQRRTYQAFEHGEPGDPASAIRARLQAGGAVQLCVIYDLASNGRDVLKLIWNNHQVLAYAFEDQIGGDVRIRVYDPNYPLRDDILLEARRVILGNQPGPGGVSIPLFGYQTVQKRTSQTLRDVHAFFPMPYTQVEPPRL